MGGREGSPGVFVYSLYWFSLLYFSEALPCLNGWVSYQEKCYFFSEHTDSWFGASAFCQAFNSKLAEPKTQEEVDFLSQQTVLLGNNSAYNIGVTDLFLEGDWVYAHSRTPVEVTLPWTNGGPDNYKEEDCVEIAAFPPYSGQYADKSCPLPSKFICEYSRVGMCQWMGAIPRQMLLFGKTKETWYAASALCQSFGSKLAEPVTQEQVVFLGRETMQIGNSGDYFIGIHDIFLEGEWMYAYSRKPVTLSMPWASGNPDNYHEEDCVEIDSSPKYHGLWGDALCSYPLYYICEYDSSENIPTVIG